MNVVIDTQTAQPKTAGAIAFLEPKHKKMLIGGAWVDAVSGKRIDSMDPATGQVLGTIPAGSKADVDLAVKAAPHVKCPVLLIVGTDDTVGVELAREALPRLAGEKELLLVPGASHLFGEPGKLEIMAELSADWFRRHLGDAGGHP